MSIKENLGAPQNKTELQQLQQRNWVKEQEVSALKVQNRHLIAKLEEAEARAKPNQLYTEQISNEIQNFLKPLASEIQRQNQVTQIQIEKSLGQAFETIQSTLRGVYQQSLRAQETVETLAAHSRDLELKMSEQRKTDQFYFQEKVFATMTTFCERIERQIESRMQAFSAIETMAARQTETLQDLEKMKSPLQSVAKRLFEIEVVGRNAQEIALDTLQQIENHRNEFKAIRKELKFAIEESSHEVEGINLSENSNASLDTIKANDRETI